MLRGVYNPGCGYAPRGNRISWNPQSTRLGGGSDQNDRVNYLRYENTVRTCEDDARSCSLRGSEFGIMQGFLGRVSGLGAYAQVHQAPR
jgi:hypothetical protein